MNIGKCRAGQITRLAERGDTNEFKARHLYGRCVRFCLRYARWNEAHCNGVPASHRGDHEHEGELLAALERRMNDELEQYGLRWDHNGIYPGLVDESGNVAIELLWYGMEE